MLAMVTEDRAVCLLFLAESIESIVHTTITTTLTTSQYIMHQRAHCLLHSFVIIPVDICRHCEK